MNYLFVLQFLILILLFALTILLVSGLFYRPPKDEIFINPLPVPENPECQQTAVPCQTDSDCSKCSDNLEMKCVELPRSPAQTKNYGDSQKYCAPVLPTQGCNSKNGGIWSWTGWTGSETMEWDCLCTYPSFAGGPGCETINPNFCKGGTVNFDARTATEPPTAEDCTCPPNTRKMITQPSGVPLCVPQTSTFCNTAKGCETMYSNSQSSSSS